MKNYSLITNITMWVLLGIGVIFSVLFFVGGSEGSLEVAGDFLDIPLYTDALLNWVYVLFGITIVATLVAVVASFVRTFKADKKKGWKQVAVTCLFAAVLVISWFLGSPDKIEILGYEGTENFGAWAQMTDAVMYSIYILMGATIAALAWGAIYSRTK